MSCCYSKKLFQKLRIVLDASRAVQEVMDIGFDSQNKSKVLEWRSMSCRQEYMMKEIYTQIYTSIEPFII